MSQNSQRDAGTDGYKWGNLVRKIAWQTVNSLAQYDTYILVAPRSTRLRL